VNIEDRIKLTLGNMIVQNTAQAAQIEDLSAKLADAQLEIAELKAKAPPPVSPWPDADEKTDAKAA
jgi:hypothetical protein